MGDAKPAKKAKKSKDADGKEKSDGNAATKSEIAETKASEKTKEIEVNLKAPPKEVAKSTLGGGWWEGIALERTFLIAYK